MSHRWTRVSGAVCLLALALAWGLKAEPKKEHTHPPSSGSPAQARGPIRITAEELHRLGGTPPGWRFRFPEGDPAAGREVFTKLECYQCHTIRGEPWQRTASLAGNIGPELTGMGGHHPVEYFAESILNPNAIIVTGPGHTDADGMSIMPNYRDSMTVAEFINLLAYLQSLKAGDIRDAEAPHDGHDEHGSVKESAGKGPR